MKDRSDSWSSDFPNFTHGESFVVSDKQCTLAWSGVAGGKMFRCAWCGHKFKGGDTARWIFTNGGGKEVEGIGGNPFVCAACDAPRDELLARLRHMRAELSRYWWFLRHSK